MWLCKNLHNVRTYMDVAVYMWLCKNRRLAWMWSPWRPHLACVWTGCLKGTSMAWPASWCFTALAGGASEAWAVESAPSSRKPTAQDGPHPEGAGRGSDVIRVIWTPHPRSPPPQPAALLRFLTGVRAWAIESALSFCELRPVCVHLAVGSHMQ